jgi:ankyrin repeat protein
VERGVVPDDHGLYLAGFADDHECLRLLVDHADVRGIARMALAAPISGKDTEGVRLLLAAGADPARYHDDDNQPVPVIQAAVRADCPAEIIGLLLDHGADPDQPGPDGRSPLALATSAGRADLAAVLRAHGATDDVTEADEFLAACLRADRAAAQRQAASQPGLLRRITGEQQAAAMIRAAEAGHLEAVRLMLDLGFSARARGGEHQATALHEAALAGRADVVRLLLGRGADLAARDGAWDDTPLGWAVVGSGFQPDGSPGADWPATVSLLIDAGAALDGITLDPGDPKPPSLEVADLLRRHGVGEEPG